MKRYQFILSALFILTFAALGASCADKRIPVLIFGLEEYTVGPGKTVELSLSVLFLDDSSDIDSGNYSRTPGRSDLKNFSVEPVISVSHPGFKILSVNTSLEDSGIGAEIIIRVPEDSLSGSSAKVLADWAGFQAETAVTVKKNPADYIDSEGVVTDPAAYDVFVNKERRMPADYIPADLVRVEVPTILSFEEVNHLRQAASDALSAMFAAAEEEQGFELLARSGYRSYNTQVSLYDLNVREYGEDYARRISARPGTSEHQSGLAMDISSPSVNYQLTEDFGDTDEGRWVAENAHRFGFILRYMKGREQITGYDYEPWHLRFVGIDLAAEIYSGDLTLEEYFDTED